MAAVSNADDKMQKMEVDYSATVEEKIPECEKLAKEGKLNEAIDRLSSLEKQTRTGADAISTGRILVAILRMCFECKKWDMVNEQIISLTKKRGQLKQAVTSMVQEAMTYVEKTPNMETKLKLIDTLRTVTSGKIYVEIERARLSRKLAKIREDEGNIAEAATVLQELQVETFGSMDKKEKVDFILEQMRLCLARKDYIRTQIISKKINIKFFEEKDTHELKLRYYQLMIDLDLHENAYLSVSKHFLAVYNTPEINSDTPKRNEALKNAIIYTILASYDNEQSDCIHRIQKDPVVEELPMYRNLLKMFTTSELIIWDVLVRNYEKELRHNTPGNVIYSTSTDDGMARWKDLKTRTVEHNIRVLAKYYTRVRMTRMAQLLDLTEAESEEFLSNLVASKTVQAKHDRLEGIVSFQRAKEPTDLLNEWSHNISSLMKLVNQTTHLITKEEMIHKVN